MEGGALHGSVHLLGYTCVSTTGLSKRPPMATEDPNKNENVSADLENIFPLLSQSFTLVNRVPEPPQLILLSYCKMGYPS